MSNLREATMNRLHGCNCETPSPPFPTHIIPVSVFEELMYKVVESSGYVGEKETFIEDFIKSLETAQAGGAIISQKESFEDFPEIGKENTFYIDTEAKTLYYWKEDEYHKVQSGIENEGGSTIPPDNLIYDGGAI